MSDLLRYREAAANSFNEEKRTVTLEFASETPCVDCFGDREVLLCDEKSMDASRFEKGVMPVLFNHDRDAVIGKPLKVWTENQKALMEIEFATNAKGQEIMELVRDGFCNGVSVGYRVNEYRDIRAGESYEGRIAGPAYIAKRWEVFEVSVVTVPADANVGIRSMEYPKTRDLQPAEKAEEPKAIEEEREMDEKKVTASEVSAEEREAAMIAERERTTQILALANQFEIDAEQRDAWVNEGTSIDEARRQVLDIVSKRTQPIAMKVEVGETNEAQLRNAYRDAIMMRDGIAVEKPAEDAARFRDMGVQTMVRNLLSRQGEKGVYELGAGQLFERAMTTGVLPALCADVAKATLVKGFDYAPVTYDKWAYVGSLRDFRPEHRVEVGASAEPVKIPENGEFTDMELKEGKKTTQLYTYGRSFAYTRQMFINDDQSVLTEIPQMLARQIHATINKLAYAALAGGNYTANTNLGTAGALSTKTLGEAMKLLRLRKDPFNAKNALNIMPKTLVVPVAHSVEALQLIGSTADPNGVHAGVKNVFANAYNVITDAELDALDADAWYLIGEPRRNYGVEVSFLNGNKTPILESQASFDTLAWKYRMYLDFGVKLMDTLNIVKNAGK
ncbi:HK97 family phage prohead protease [Phascolarctobacterium sp.]|uniref:phage major capsid protein n=1 Tax=Phascolarctobacterium sp. TaxID=2049039 RepID=UPI00386428DA